MPINNTEKNFPRRKITFGEIKFDVSLYIITRAELTPLYTQHELGTLGKKFGGEVVEVNVKLSWTLLFNTKRFCRCLNTVDTCLVTGRDCGY